MKTKIFKTTDNLSFVIKNTKTFIIFETIEESNSYKFLFRFNNEVYKELTNYLHTIAKETWTDFTPKCATSLRTDYCEYYDRKFDNNGYLDIIENGFKIERPTLDSLKLYQLNKDKLESLIYDITNKNNS